MEVFGVALKAQSFIVTEVSDVLLISIKKWTILSTILSSYIQYRMMHMV